MSTNFETKKHAFRSLVEEQTTGQLRVIKTTLGDLIAAVTDEVMPFVHEPSVLYPVVSCIINDVLARRRRGSYNGSGATIAGGKPDLLELPVIPTA
jgi:hypothetical protein